MSDLKLRSTWNVWVHDVYLKDWNLQSYKHVLTINTIADMWTFLNNINKLNFESNNFFVMKGNIKPLWEDEQNKHGGALKIQFVDNALDAFEDFVVYALNDDLMQTDANSINGISFNPKKKCTIVKIWNNVNRDIFNHINPTLKTKYQGLSIKYEQHKPEY